MAVFHARGKPVQTDGLSEVYSNRPFDQLHHATDQVCETLSGVWASVCDPFPQDTSRHNPSISLATIRRIQEMRAQGFKYRVICRELGVCMDTVRRYGASQKLLLTGEFSKKVVNASPKFKPT